MKTAISISTALFTIGDQLAKRLRVSRSQLYAIALKEFIEAHSGDKITETLNQVYQQEDSPADSTLSRMQFSVLPKDEW